MVSSGCGSVASNLLSGSGAGVCVSAFATLTCLGSIRRDSVEVFRAFLFDFDSSDLVRYEKSDEDFEAANSSYTQNFFCLCLIDGLSA